MAVDDQSEISFFGPTRDIAMATKLDSSAWVMLDGGG